MRTQKWMALTALAAGVSMLGSAALADSGIFGSYVAIDVDGPGAAGLVWYGAQQPGSNLLTDFNTLNLGTFAAGSAAYIAGAELESWKNNGSNVTGATLSYRVDSGAWQTANIGWTANATFSDAASNSFSGSGDQKWAQLADTSINFLSGVAAGAHTLQVSYAIGSSDGGASSASYTANFTVTAVPEPASMVLMTVGLMGLLAWRRRQA